MNVFALLRIRIREFQKALQGCDRMIQILYRVFQLEREEFIWELHWQLFQREPEPADFYRYLADLYKDMNKFSVASAMLQSEEAERIFRTPAESSNNSTSTIAGIMRRIYSQPDLDFVHALYKELLSRTADLSGLESHIYHLQLGVLRPRLIHEFLLSEECRQILSNPKPPVDRTRSLQVGFFLGYPMKVSLDGEGIGRFITRLLQGLIYEDKELVIHIAAFDYNYQHLVDTFSGVKAAFPDRLIIHAFQDIERLNRNVKVDVWIIPYVGLELAVQLEKPYILCLHDIVHIHFRELYYKEQPQWCCSVEKIAAKVANKASAVLFQSNYTRAHEGLSFLKLPEEKTHVVRFAPPIEEYQTIGVKDESQFRAEHQLHYDYIVFPSVIRLHKNHVRLIEAFLSYRRTAEGDAAKIRLVLTDHYEHRPYKKEITALLQTCTEELRSSVVFLDRLSSHDIPSLYKYAVGTIVPTLFEGAIPFPVLESLLMDTPVAVSRIGVTQEVVKDMEAMLAFDPYNVEDMRNSIHNLVKHNRALLAKQKKEIKGLLHRSWTDVAHDYCRIINKLLHQPM